jgi:hypothetical protein
MKNEIALALLDPFFIQCIKETSGNKELVKEFDRLTGSNLSLSGTGLDLAIDKATGRMKDDCEKFLKFVYECVYLKLKE